MKFLVLCMGLKHWPLGQIEPADAIVQHIYQIAQYAIGVSIRTES